MLLGRGLGPWLAVTFFFSLGRDDGCPLAEALHAAIEAVGKPLGRWQDASMTGVEALTATIEELEAGGGTKDFEILGAEAFEALGLAT